MSGISVTSHGDPIPFNPLRVTTVSTIELSSPAPTAAYTSSTQSPIAVYSTTTIIPSVGSIETPTSSYGIPVNTFELVGGNGLSATTFGPPPASVSELPTDTYLPPATAYGPPVASYRVPASNYKSPLPVSVPELLLNSIQTGYNAPLATFGVAGVHAGKSTGTSRSDLDLDKAGAGYGLADVESSPANYDFSYRVQDDYKALDFGAAESRRG